MCSFETTSRESCCIQISPTTRVVLSTLCDLNVSVPSCMPSPTLSCPRLVFHRAQRVHLLAGRAPVPWKDMVWYIIRYNVLGVPDSIIIVHVDNVDFGIFSFVIGLEHIRHIGHSTYKLIKTCERMRYQLHSLWKQLQVKCIFAGGCHITLKVSQLEVLL